MITSSSSAIFPSLAVIGAEFVLLSYVVLWLAPSGEVIGSDPFEKVNLDGGRAGETKTHTALSVMGLWVQEMAKKKHKRRKERGIHNRAIIPSSDNWLCYMNKHNPNKHHVPWALPHWTSPQGINLTEPLLAHTYTHSYKCDSTSITF